MNDFISWFETLSPQTLEAIDQHYTEDVYFRDPFNEHYGIGHIKTMLAKMFDGPLKHNKFHVLDRIQDAEKVFITWDYTFELKNKPYKIHGSSFLKFKENKCYYHKDYWDTGEELYQKVPILGRIIRKINKNFQR